MDYTANYSPYSYKSIVQENTSEVNSTHYGDQNRARQYHFAHYSTLNKPETTNIESIEVPLAYQKSSLYLEDIKKYQPIYEEKLCNTIDSIGTLQHDLKKLQMDLAVNCYGMNKSKKREIEAKINVITTLLAKNGVDRLELIQKSRDIKYAIERYKSLGRKSGIDSKILAAAKIALKNKKGYEKFVESQNAYDQYKNQNLFDQNITADPKTDFQTYTQQIYTALSGLKEKGFYTVGTTTLFIKEFAEGTVKRIVNVAQYPVEYIQGFVEGNLELAKQVSLLFIDAYSAPEELYVNEREMQLYEQRCAQRAEQVKQLYGKLSETVPQMNRQQWAEISSQLFVDYLLLNGLGKGVNKLKISSLSNVIKENNFLKGIEETLGTTLLDSKVVTPDGVIIKGSQLGETNLLKNTVDKTKKVVDEVKEVAFLSQLNKAKEKLAPYKEWFEKAAKIEKTLLKTKPSSVTPTDLTTYLKHEKEIEKAYEIIRQTNDVSKIAKNTGLSDKMIQRIKNHVFFEQHKLEHHGMRRFFADGDMVVAWRRLQENKALASDILMLKHELAESIFKESFGLSHDPTHALANEFYNWNNVFK